MRIFQLGENNEPLEEKKQPINCSHNVGFCKRTRINDFFFPQHKLWQNLFLMYVYTIKFHGKEVLT